MCAHDRLGVGQIEHFVRHAGFDVNEVAGGVVDRLRQPIAEFMPHAPAQDVQHHLEADMDVRVGDAARRHGRDVHRQLAGVDVFRRQPGLVGDAVPGAHGLAAADDGDATVVLDELGESIERL